MNTFITILAYLNSIPARLKGMQFGAGAMIGPGYDWLTVKLNNIKLGDNVVIGRNAWLQTGDKGDLNIGQGTQIGRNVMITTEQSIEIGEECLLSYNVSLMDHDHETNKPELSPMKSGITKPKSIEIGEHCFIGAHSFILKGVKLGKHCVVGANTVVTKSFPAYSVIAGNPAKLIKTLKPRGSQAPSR
ncbi:MAG: DapH/DapD/GlmU-related protein [Weeksellaceae bacterium]